MDIKISEEDTTTKTVSVTFTEGDVVFTRAVNACYDDAGAYDADATKTRVDAVALGVANKIALGVISGSATATTTTDTAETASTDTGTADASGSDGTTSTADAAETATAAGSTTEE